MCCFSGKVEEVDATSIFARMTEPGRQLLVYELSFSASSEVAMVLPLPVPRGTSESEVSFIDMKGLSSFFSRLNELFTLPMMRLARASQRTALASAALKVHVVGDFVASFVPTLADFSRLDPRFRMPSGTLDRVQEYADWGFGVFQLSSYGKRTKVHPMAFEFPTREGARLFFPTLHVHDGKLPRTADYAHKLYAQGGKPEDSWDPAVLASSSSPWRAPVHLLSNLFSGLSPEPEVSGSGGDHDYLMNLVKVREQMTRLVSPSQELQRREITGTHKNQDTWVPLAG